MKASQRKTTSLLHLSTVAAQSNRNQPWVKIQSAGWVNIQSAPTFTTINHQKRCSSDSGLIALDPAFDGIARDLKPIALQFFCRPSGVCNAID
jgi:hypothetical protein